jgi:hypothetical protein
MFANQQIWLKMIFCCIKECNRCNDNCDIHYKAYYSCNLQVTTILKSCCFSFLFKFELYHNPILSLEAKLMTGTKLKLLIDKVNKIEQTCMKNIIRFYLLPSHSVNNCRIGFKSVNYQNFLYKIVYDR